MTPAAPGSAGGLGLPVLLLTLGDPAGIGPEVLLKAAKRWIESPDPPARLAIAAPAALLNALSRKLGLDLQIPASRPELLDNLGSPLLSAIGWDPPQHSGCMSGEAMEREGAVLPMLAAEVAAGNLANLPAAPGRAGGAAAWLSLSLAVSLTMDAPRTRAVVTAPLCKESLSLAGFSWPGHTEYLGWRCGVPDPLMWLCSPRISVGLVSNHDSIRELPAAITLERVERKTRLLLAHLAHRHPGERLTVLGLNPHAGDGGVLGSEEREWLGPLLERLRREGLSVDGPMSADAALAHGEGRFLAMYHDQGLPVFKLVAGQEGVNATLGLPIVRCSPDHGTAFDIAGKGLADEGSQRAAMLEALRLLAKDPGR